MPNNNSKKKQEKQRTADSQMVIFLKLLIVFVILLVPLGFILMDLGNVLFGWDKADFQKEKRQETSENDFNFQASLPAEKSGDISSVSPEKINSLFDNLHE